MANQLLPPCVGIPIRKDPPGTLEWTAAELWIRWRYKHAFEGSRKAPFLVTWQLERLFTNYDNAQDPVIDLVMTVLESDFRNVTTDAQRAAFQLLLKQNATEPALRAFLRQLSPGGNRRPDMLGISTGGTAIEFDAVEVGTVTGAQATYDELQSKLGILRDSVVPQVRLELPRLQAGYQSTFIPPGFTVSGSAWRPSQWERILPLPVKISKEGNVQYVDWICYYPTMYWRAPNSPPLQQGDPGGENGLILYHIHRLPAKSLEIPPNIKTVIDREIQRWKLQHSLSLELNPALALALKANKTSFDPAAIQMLAVLGAGALLFILLGVAWEAGLVVGAAELASSGLAGLSGSAADLFAAIGQSSEVGSAFWPGVSSDATLLFGP
jgi:hypothetical protein